MTQKADRVYPKDIECADCGEPFQLTQGEMDFYTTKGLHMPKRCKPCRKIKTAKMNKTREATS